MKTRSLLLCGAAFALTLGTPHFPACLAETFADSEAGKYAGSDATVTGKVASVSKPGNGTVYVNFGDKFPRQTFSGVVFAKDAGTVGDLAQFEGKTVALTGRIELSRAGKPQIIIRSAEQLKLADGAALAVAVTPPAPMPVPTVSAPSIASLPSTPSIPSPPPTSPPKDEKRSIALSANWTAAPQTGDLARKDLAMLFGGSFGSSEKSVPEDKIAVYPGVPYLAPLTDARKTLHLENTNPSRIKITTPGLPVASLTANAFPGIFPGGYTTMTLVTDAKEQVVSVHLTDHNPRVRSADITDKGGYHIYNFIAQREKSAGQLVIKHEIVREGAPAGVVVVDSLLIDPSAPDPNAPPRTSGKSSKAGSSSHRPRTGKVLERSRWYVPKPLANVILRASGNR